MDSGSAFVIQNADPITDREDYHNFDESGVIRGRIVEESLMGKNAARRCQREINEIVEDQVPLNFLPLWKKIRSKMQKVIKKYIKKQDLLFADSEIKSACRILFSRPTTQLN